MADTLVEKAEEKSTVTWWDSRWIDVVRVEDGRDQLVYYAWAKRMLKMNAIIDEVCNHRFWEDRRITALTGCWMPLKSTRVIWMWSMREQIVEKVCNRNFWEARRIDAVGGTWNLENTWGCSMLCVNYSTLKNRNIWESLRSLCLNRHGRFMQQEMSKRCRLSKNPSLSNRNGVCGRKV